MAEQITEGVIVAIRAAGRFLMVRRSKHVPLPGTWCFPGGAVRPGETQPAALVREVLEEVGLRVEPIEKLWEWTRPDGLLRLHWWSAKIGTGADAQQPKANPSEVAETRWCSPDEIRALPNLLQNNLDFLDHLDRLARTTAGRREEST
jgi:(d)CTP diphosphatase